MLGLALSCCGLFVLWLRLYRGGAAPADHAEDFPFVSILVPCRNEALRLPALLASLKRLEYPRYEILVIDDHSEDGTAKVAQDGGAKVLRAPPRPSDWVGKNWACWTGSTAAQGELLLFTDADTIHAPDSLLRAVARLKSQKFDLLTAVPYHLCRQKWERIFGAFQLLPLIISAYRQESSKRIFAIGQYLLFTQESYFKLGGHAKVSSSLAEDLDLGFLWRQNGLRVGVMTEPGVYKVQMYDSFAQFFQGWRRIIRLGFHRSSLIATAELVLIFQLLLFGPMIHGDLYWAPFFAGLALLTPKIGAAGHFTKWGALFAPLSVALFIVISLFAALDALLGKEVQWRGRSYSNA